MSVSGVSTYHNFTALHCALFASNTKKRNLFVCGRVIRLTHFLLTFLAIVLGGFNRFNTPLVPTRWSRVVRGRTSFGTRRLRAEGQVIGGAYTPVPAGFLGANSNRKYSWLNCKILC